MIKRFCARLGLNYIWGLTNFTAGVILGCGYSGIIAGMMIHHGH